MILFLYYSYTIIILLLYYHYTIIIYSFINIFIKINTRFAAILILFYIKTTFLCGDFIFQRVKFTDGSVVDLQSLSKLWFNSILALIITNLILLYLFSFCILLYSFVLFCVILCSFYIHMLLN